ncbi:MULTISPECIES: DUF4276 family protein [Vibrio harveyi group]|uniref:DUF4276 family protein n=1 Tax=Vibrio harveyi group TaxID=717610 RepID=UPI001D1E28E2|nr:DUF4276 family protein [Vibrio parahaemolyticus]EHH1058347.1 DUF4276 family protein [Vibrio parahaemolyticus]EHK9064152.1 hypothetical protein [Vibrio parahaemolyticus]EHZ2781374.1 hypothetical protein [Vibrio parahaemolyticus]EJG0697354.1 hypothetical protein [Vibrio parahaemolyticus]MCS0092361.1 DUF4276 family protein [Vibrio parahaemolyticus]
MIYVLVEGADDKRFVNKVLSPILKEKYGGYKVWEYAKKKDVAINNFIKSINSMGSDCLFLVDSDNNEADEIKKKYLTKFSQLQEEKISVVLREIEAWYLSGINEDTFTNKLSKKIPADTSHITKEMFETYFMRLTGTEAKIESLINYDVHLACQRSPSFKDLLYRF